MKRPTVCVIFGGKSREYEVSLKSAYSILSNIDSEKYRVIRLGISREGKWYIFQGENEEILKNSWESGNITSVNPDINTGELVLSGGERIRADLFFPVMHGEYCEDGRLQGLFEMWGVKYVGCDSFSSHTGMDKALTKLVARSLGIPVAPDIILRSREDRDWENLIKQSEKLGYPLFVKASMGGSSVGVYLVKEKEELLPAIQKAFEHSPCVIIEKGITGRETELAVMEVNGKILLSESGTVNHKSGFYDYAAKYESDCVEYEIPAGISEKAKKQIRDYGKNLFLALGCVGLSRIDFFVTDEDKVIFNEINTMPGFTEISMFPKLFMNEGMSLRQIIDHLIDNVLKN